MHHSIFPCGRKPTMERCTCCSKFHCPICPKGLFKPCPPSKILRHLQAHVKNAISFEDKNICRCHLNCRKGGHYHCPICNKTVLRKTDMEAHLKFCRIQQTSTSAAAQSNQSEDSSLPSLQPSSSAASICLLPPTIKSPSPDLLVQQDTTTIPSAQSIQTSTSHSSADTHMTSSSPLVSSSVVHTAQETQGPKLKRKKVQCPLCSLTCFKRNLAKHIQRRHPEVNQSPHAR